MNHSSRGVEVLLLRHEETPHNAESRYQGSSEPGLSEAGRRRTRRLRPILEAKLGDADGLWCSALRRSQETARLLFPEREIQVDSRLNELDFGDLEGLTSREAEEQVGESYVRWRRNPESEPPPGGEPLSEVEERVIDWLGGLSPGSGHLAVTHVVPIRVAMAVVLEIPLRRLRPLWIDPGDWVRLVVPADRSLEGRL